MTTCTLTIIDTTGIQEYIFGSNRLRENIGASHLVERATGSYVEQALQNALGESHDIADLTQELALEHSSQQAEIIYAGGGNVLLLFRTSTAAKATVRELSKLLHTHAPGLQIAVAHCTFDWDHECIGRHNGQPGVLAHLYADLGHKKQLRPPVAPLHGLGVTLACSSTGLPAMGTSAKLEPEERFVSANTLEKLRALKSANEAFTARLYNITQDYAIPKDFDDLGRSRDEQSYIAVVHIDGNSMGKRFEEIGDKTNTNREYIHAVRDLSIQINTAAQTALTSTLTALTNTLASQPPKDNINDETHLWLELIRAFCGDLAKEKNTDLPFFPFRPLVIGGDDVTFVCDGRLGITLALRFIHSFEQATIDLPGGTASACAGVAIVKSHYPFARAYALAEDLCQTTKRKLREAEIDDYSALDWHIIASGRSDSISEIREREYLFLKKVPLTARPVLLLPADQYPPSGWKYGTWLDLERTVTILNYDKEWRERRNKVIALREVLRQGEDAVEQFKTRYGIKDLPHSHPAGLFDAIETMEFLLPLAPPQLNKEVGNGAA